MSEESSFDHFTKICLAAGLLLGLVGGVTYNGFLTPLLQSYLGVFGVERQPGSYQGFGTVFAVVVLGLAGAGALYASVGIEKGETESTRTTVMTLAGILAFTLIPPGIVAFSFAMVDGGPLGVASFFMLIFGLVGLIMMIPAIVCWVVMFPLALGLAAGGLFCLPRLLLYYTTRHPLLTAWQKSNGNRGITPTDIADALGNPAKNTTQARKLQADLERVEREVNEHRKTLAAEREQLRSAILRDAERFETEKRISSILINIDTLNTEVEGYRKYVRQKGAGR